MFTNFFNNVDSSRSVEEVGLTETAFTGIASCASVSALGFEESEQRIKSMSTPDHLVLGESANPDTTAVSFDDLALRLAALRK